MKTKTVQITVSVIFIMLFALSVSAQTPTSIQVLYTSDKAKAEAVAEKINKLGYGPAEIRDNSGGFKVLTRTYESYGEANFYKLRIRKAGFPDAFSVKQQVESKGLVFGDPPSVSKSSELKQLRIDFQTLKKPIERPEMTDELRKLDISKADEKTLFQRALAFSKNNEADSAIETINAFITRFPGSEKTPKAKLMKAYWLLKTDNTQSARDQFEAITRDHAGAPEAGEAHLRCAYLMLLNKRPDPYVLKRFLKIARGEVPAEKEVRLEAMLRCAALYYRMKDLDTSAAAYMAIENATRDSELRAFARMQRGAIMLEKAYNGKVPYSESRRLCDGVLKEFPDANKQTRSTSALMLIETLCHEEKYEEVVLRSDEFFDEFLNLEEAPIAHYWIAKAYHKTGNNGLALGLLNDIVAEDGKTEKRFKFLNVNRAARRLQSDIRKQSGKDKN